MKIFSFILFSGLIIAQPQSGITRVNSAPGSCSQNQVFLVMPSGDIYTCVSGIPTKYGGGASGNSFGAITTGTNTVATMTVGSGASLTVPTQSTGDASGLTSNDQFVAASLASINPAVAVQAATTAVLSNTPTYANGTAGVGATLTAGSNGVLTIDSYSPVLNDRVLVKNQASTLQNGVYSLTTVGTVSVPYVLTRATDYNATANINYTGTIPVLQGTTNANTGWLLNNQITAVGTSALTYTQDSVTNSGGPPGGNVKAQGNLSNGNAIEGAGGKTIVDSGISFSHLVGRTASVTFDGGGSALTGSLTRCTNDYYSGTIQQVVLISDVSGSATVDVKTVAYSSYTGPSSASTITASDTPALSSAIKYSDTSLTGWTTSLSANSIICFVLTSPSTVTWVQATLKIAAN